jgi:hypothetical protein
MEQLADSQSIILASLSQLERRQQGIQQAVGQLVMRGQGESGREI